MIKSPAVSFRFRDRRSGRRGLLLGLLLALYGLALQAEESRLVIRAGTLYTVDDAQPSPLHDAWILIENGKVLEVSTDRKPPPGVPTLDFSRETILPGLVASNVTMRERPPAKSVGAEFLAVDAYDFFSENKGFLAGGVTTLGVSTGSKRLLSGRGVVVKTANRDGKIDERILRRVGAFHVTLGEASKNPPTVYDPPVPPSPDNPFEVLKRQAPVSRGGALRALGQVLDRVRDFRVVVEAARRGEGPPLELDPELEPFLDLLDQRDPLIVHVERVHDMLAMLDFAKKHQLKLLFDGARESHRIATVLQESGVPLIVRGEFLPGVLPSGDLSRRSLSGDGRDGLAASLIHAGLRVAIRGPTTRHAPSLLLQAVEAMSHGLSESQALRSITREPAELLGVGSRVGSIAPGKDADFLVLSENPFRGGGQCVAVFIDGKRCYPRESEKDASKKESASPSAEFIAVRCGTLYTASEETFLESTTPSANSGDSDEADALAPDAVIHGGVVLIKDGKVEKVGTAALLDTLPSGTRIIDASTESVLPGLIDCGSHLGLHRDTVLPERMAETPSAGGGSAMYRVADAIDFTDPQIEVVRRSGITTVVLTPDPERTFAGQLTAVKLSGEPLEKAVLRDPAGLLLGSINGNVLKKAKSYHDALLKFEEAEEVERKEKKDRAIESLKIAGAEQEKGAEKKKEKPKKPSGPPKKPDPNEEYDVVRSLFRKKVPVVVRIVNEQGLSSAYTNLIEKYKLRTIVYGLNELSPEAIRDLRRREVEILLEPGSVWEKSALELVHLPRQLDAAGVPFAFRSGQGSGSRQLRLQVAYAARRGWSEEEALKSMTISAARIFGIDDRVGSLEPGKDADLVFMNGSPFSMTSRVTRVIVNGKLVYAEGGEEP